MVKSVGIGGGILRGGGRRGAVMTLPLAAGPTTVDLVGSMLLCLGCEGIIPEDLFHISLLLLESIERSAGSTLLGSPLLVGFLVGSLLEVTIGLIVAMDEPVVLLAMVGAPVAILAFHGFLGAAFLGGVALALLILLGDTASFYCLCSLVVPFLLEGFLKPLLLGSVLPILRL
jgi:hypothetical protein